MNKIGLIIIFLFVIDSTINCQKDSSNDFIANLSNIRMVSDGVSRYSEPKISPSGTRILTMRNHDTLIYIDLLINSEIVVMAGGFFNEYYWIDDNLIYYYLTSENSNSLIYGEIGKISVEPFSKQIDFTFSRIRNSNMSKSERIPILLKGKFDVYTDIYRNKVYKMENGLETEITHDEGNYFNLLLSNNEKRVIIHKNNGIAYNFDYNGSGDYFQIVNGIVTSWAPDDKYLLYFKDRETNEGYFSDLYICTSDGREHQILTNTMDVREFHPDWSSKSDKLVFIDNINRQIYISTINVK